MRRWVLGVRGIRWHSWEQEDEAVVFNPESGNTHVISAFALEILTLLQASGGLTVKALRENLLDVLPDGATAGANGTIDVTLVQLEDIGLVVPTPLESF